MSLLRASPSLPILGIYAVLQNSFLSFPLYKISPSDFICFQVLTTNWMLMTSKISGHSPECQHHITSWLLVIHVQLGSQTISTIPNLLFPMLMTKWHTCWEKHEKSPFTIHFSSNLLSPQLTSVMFHSFYFLSVFWKFSIHS